MNEAERVAGEHPDHLLGMVLECGTECKARLFGVACCLRIRGLMTDPRSRAAVEKAELFTEGMRTRPVLSDA